MHRALVLPARLLPLVLVGTVAVSLAPAPARAATAVDLGTAGAFAVLAGSGITNTGQTTITGDIGTSPTPSETGVAPCPTAADCVVLSGSNHPADATALKAKQDLTTAYDAAAGQSADAALAADLGGLTFTTGVYNAAGALGLTGEVTLDAKNVAGAVFVFQVGSRFVTASDSSVRLVNGASACNVFFQVGSAATLGTRTVLRGTVLAHDDISVGDAVTVDGRLLGGQQASGAGAVTLIHDTITVPSCASGGGTGGATGGTGGSSGSTTGTGGATTGTGTGGSTSTGTTGAGSAAGTTSGATASGGGSGSTTPGSPRADRDAAGTLPYGGSRMATTVLAALASVAVGWSLLVRARRRTTGS